MKSEIKVKGMHCISCEMLIKDTLENLKGVKVIRASSRHGKIVVKHPETELKTIKKIIKGLGYRIK